MSDKSLYGVAIKDVFGKWVLPSGAQRGRQRARDFAHFLLVKGWSSSAGEIKAVQVIPWGSRAEMRSALS